MAGVLHIDVFLHRFTAAEGCTRSAGIQAADTGQLAHHHRRQQEQSLSRALRGQCLAQYLQADASHLQVATHALGKPFLLDYPGVEFNQSHSRAHWLLAANRQGVALGVDIEDRQRQIDCAPLARRVLTRREHAYFAGCAQPQACLLKLWTIKEAILKGAGLGIRINLNTLDTGCCLNGQGSLTHEQLGAWHYQCFESRHAYYTVAWQAARLQSIRFRQVAIS